MRVADQRGVGEIAQAHGAVDSLVHHVDLAPQIACPHTVDNVKPVDAVAGVAVPNNPGYDQNGGASGAAVEVLNEIGTPAHVKALLQSIKDDDWWVRSRAADALAKIGGPRVIEAISGLAERL